MFGILNDFFEHGGFMHIRHLISMTACLAAVLSFSLAAHASTFTFADSYVAFPGYPKKTPDYNSQEGTVDPKTGDDEYGNPLIDSMTVVVNDSKRLLQAVTLNLRSDYRITWDNLFINTSYVNLNGVSDKTWDQSWDYFVHSGGSVLKDGGNSRVSANASTENGLFAVTGDFNITDGYSTTLDTRYNHPNGIATNYLGKELPGNEITGVSSFRQITYDFSGLTIGGITGGIPILDGFTIAYSPWCANDIFLASAAVPTPEPATLLLFGSGIVGLAGLAHRRRKK